MDSDSLESPIVYALNPAVNLRLLWQNEFKLFLEEHSNFSIIAMRNDENALRGTHTKIPANRP